MRPSTDRLLGNREIVVRPLPPLRGSRLPLDGVTILADGSLVLLVDAASLAAPVSAARRS